MCLAVSLTFSNTFKMLGYSGSSSNVAFCNSWRTQCFRDLSTLNNSGYFKILCTGLIRKSSIFKLLLSGFRATCWQRLVNSTFVWSRDWTISMDFCWNNERSKCDSYPVEAILCIQGLHKRWLQQVIEYCWLAIVTNTPAMDFFCSREFVKSSRSWLCKIVMLIKLENIVWKIGSGNVLVKGSK